MFGYQVLGFGSGETVREYNVDVLLVAGGGSGGGQGGAGGGGAGGFLESDSVAVSSASPQTITIGA